MTMPLLSARLDGLYIGKVAHRWPDKASSAIQKNPVDESQTLLKDGFVQDAQADLSVHGGADKAVHHYAADHYPDWIAEQQIPEGTRPAAFGENLSTVGMTEHTLCIGDIFSLGTATVQISQGRQPCWKLNSHTGNDRMAFHFLQTLRTGWYYRVLDEGQVTVGDNISLVERLHPSWTVARVTHARLTKKVSAEDATQLAELPELANGWREAFHKMCTGNFNENTNLRLKGSAD